MPVLIAVGAASLVAFAFSLKLSPMTAVGGPLVVAACTEFTSLILLRFVEERRRGSIPRGRRCRRGAHRASVHRVGLTAISGVAVIATSSLPLLRDFGIIVAMNVAVALLSASSSFRRCWSGPTSATGCRASFPDEILRGSGDRPPRKSEPPAESDRDRALVGAGRGD